MFPDAVCTAYCERRPRPHGGYAQATGEFFHFRQHAFTAFFSNHLFPVQSEREFSVSGASELQSAHGETDRAVLPRTLFDPVDPADAFRPTNQFRRFLRQRPPVSLYTRRKIRIVIGIHALFPAARIVFARLMDVDEELGGCRTRIANPMTRRCLGARRNEDGEPFDDQPLLAMAKIVQPDQTESESVLGLGRIFGCADRRETGLSFAQESAGIARRELCSRSCSALSSAIRQSGNWRCRDCRKRSRYLRRTP